MAPCGHDRKRDGILFPGKDDLLRGLAALIILAGCAWTWVENSRLDSLPTATETSVHLQGGSQTTSEGTRAAVAGGLAQELGE